MLSATPAYAQVTVRRQRCEQQPGVVQAQPSGLGVARLAVLTGRLGRSRVHEQRIVAKLPVRSRQGALRLARDGEAAEGPGHLLLRAAHRPLVVYRPAPES